MSLTAKSLVAGVRGRKPGQKTPPRGKAAREVAPVGASAGAQADPPVVRREDLRLLNLIESEARHIAESYDLDDARIHAGDAVTLVEQLDRLLRQKAV